MGSMNDIQQKAPIGPLVSIVILLLNIIISVVLSDNVVVSIVNAIAFFFILFMAHYFFIRIRKDTHDYIGFKWLDKSSMINAMFVSIAGHFIGFLALLIIPIVHFVIRLTIHIKDDRIYLSEEWVFNDRNMKCKKGTIINFYKNGKIKELTLKDDWVHPTFHFILKAGTKVVFSPKHHFLKYTLAENYQGNQKATIKAGEEIEFYENQWYKKVVIAYDINDENGKIIPANKNIYFKESGSRTVNSKFEIDQYLKNIDKIDDI